MDGLVVKYDDMTPIPVISYNQTNNALVFNSTVQTPAGIASAESETLELNSPAFLNKVCR